MTDKTSKVNGWLREHGAALFLSVVIGGIIVAPPLMWRMSPDYRGIDMMKTNTETLYLSMINEVIDGHWGLGNPYLFEGKDAPYLFPPLSAYLIGGVGKIFGVSAVDAGLIMRFILPALIAFLIYRFALALTGNKLVGLITAPFVLLGYPLMAGGGIQGLLDPNVWGQEKMFIDYGRPITPQVSVLLFYLYLVVFWRYLGIDSDPAHLEGRGRQITQWLNMRQAQIYGVLCTLILGLAFYTYFYTWTYLFAFNAFAFLYYGWRKDWGKVKKIFAVSTVAGLIGLPYLWRNFAITSNPLYADISARFGFVHQRQPFVSKTMIGALLVFLAAYKALPKQIKEFFTIIFFTGFFTVNQHVLTGLYFRFDNHHHWYYNRPMVMLLLVIVGFIIVEKLQLSKKNIYCVTAGCILLFVYTGIIVQKVSYAAALPEVREEQRVAPVITWLKEKTPKDAVVLAENPLRIFIPSLTHDNIYYTGGALYTLTPHERVAHSYLAFTYLKLGHDADTRAYFLANREDVSDWLFGYTYRVQPGVCLSCFSDAVIDDLVARYEKINDDNFIDYLRKYRIDYIVWDEKLYPEWRVDRFGLAEAASFPEAGVVVYRVVDKTNMTDKTDGTDK